HRRRQPVVRALALARGARRRGRVAGHGQLGAQPSDLLASRPARARSSPSAAARGPGVGRRPGAGVAGVGCLTMSAVGQRPRPGLAVNWRQFPLLVVVNAFVGAMVGMERTVVPLLAEQEFGIASASATLSFLVAFGVVKAATNLAAGHFSDRYGRKPLLIAGW